MDDAESYPFRRNTDPSGRGRHIALVGDRYPRTQCLILYLEIVRVEEPPRPTDREVTCLSCGGPLHGREGRFLLKYFLTIVRNNAPIGLLSRKPHKKGANGRSTPLARGRGGLQSKLPARDRVTELDNLGRRHGEYRQAAGACEATKGPNNSCCRGSSLERELTRRKAASLCAFREDCATMSTTDAPRVNSGIVPVARTR